MYSSYSSNIFKNTLLKKIFCIPVYRLTIELCEISTLYNMYIAFLFFFFIVGDIIEWLMCVSCGIVADVVVNLVIFYMDG